MYYRMTDTMVDNHVRGNLQ